MIIRRVLFILVGKNKDGGDQPDGFKESWFNAVSKRLVASPYCGGFLKKYINFNLETLEYVMNNGSSTFARAYAAGEQYLRDLIDHCHQLETPEEVMAACERHLTMADLEIAADATYVSATRGYVNYKQIFLKLYSTKIFDHAARKGNIEIFSFLYVIYHMNHMI